MQEIIYASLMGVNVSFTMGKLEHVFDITIAEGQVHFYIPTDHRNDSLQYSL